ncbi:hypothetical protein Tco_0892670 [Tanacetum coccineum]|uniref:Uncharacterized protein n=1 Tax=Tanacetum coccineum TaxID=301880 RepID=A0ABQ5C7X2_9ASTR
MYSTIYREPRYTSILELPGMPEDPYVEAALYAPPSPDYVPSPEEPEQHLPSPDYVPGPEHTGIKSPATAPKTDW